VISSVSSRTVIAASMLRAGNALRVGKPEIDQETGSWSGRMDSFQDACTRRPDGALAAFIARP
jgi:hypothetical protein